MNEKYDGLGVIPERKVPVPELPSMMLVVPRADVWRQLAAWAAQCLEGVEPFVQHRPRSRRLPGFLEHPIPAEQMSVTF